MEIRKLLEDELLSLNTKHGLEYLILDYIDEFINSNEDDLEETLLDIIHEQEVIYYNTALDYLSVHDPSLQSSLSLAHEYGYKINELNSEILATLLYQNNLKEDLYDHIDNLKNILNKINNDIE